MVISEGFIRQGDKRSRYINDRFRKRGGTVQNQQRAASLETGYGLTCGTTEAKVFGHNRDMISEHFWINSSAFFSSMTSLTYFLQLSMVV